MPEVSLREELESIRAEREAKHRRVKTMSFVDFVLALTKPARPRRVVTLPPDAHLVINALQRRSAVVVQKSLREGFALTVSEALWKQRAVVASAVGGIPLQVLHGRTGLLVHSVEGCALQLVRLLREPSLRRRLGREGREHVRDNFLHTREARDYLAVFAHLLESRAAGAPAGDTPR